MKPSNAATIWIEDNFIWLDLPMPNGQASHKVHVTNDSEGWAWVKATLIQRHAESRLGEAGDPTQWHTDKDTVSYYDPGRVRRAKPKFSPTVLDGAKEILRRMNII